MSELPSALPQAIARPRGVREKNSVLFRVPKAGTICIAEAIELYEADRKPLPPATANKEYSGRFVLRVDKELHREVAIRALRAGERLNSYCQKILKKAVEQR
ncbi:MAG TPA: toxin-antitoxin system HicB family antitoxin [Geobacteraceae bacterium]